MDNLVYIAILFLCLLFLLKLLQNYLQKRRYPYKKKFLLTKAEHTFHKILQEECDRKHLRICPKVRMEDFLEVTDKKNYMKYRGYVKSRHIDFLICDQDMHILCGIELDDSSHNTDAAQKTDNFKNNVFKAIDIPLFRIKVSSVSSYRTEILNIMDIL